MTAGPQGNPEVDNNLAPSITTATKLDLSQSPPFPDDITIGAVSEWAPSNITTTGEHVVFPSPPTLAEGQQEFQCPYCFTICPKKMKNTAAWRYEKYAKCS
jgi:hypothetical protein